METTKIIKAEEIRKQQLLGLLKAENEKLKADLDYVIMKTGLTLLNEEEEYGRNQIPES